jgi:mono/diheme cytochrome c family protein
MIRTEGAHAPFVGHLMNRSLGVLLVSIAWLAISAPCGADSGEPDIPPPEKTAGIDLRDPKVIEKGMETLNSTCGGYCHGSAGRGYKGPALRNRPDLTTDDMVATIKFGRKRAGKLMPGWAGTLSEEEIWSVIAAIVSLRHADGDAPQGNKAGTH